MKTLGYIFYTVILVASGIFSSIYFAWVFTLAWRWFAVPYFGLDALSLGQSLAILLLVPMLNGTLGHASMQWKIDDLHKNEFGHQDDYELKQKIKSIIISPMLTSILLGLLAIWHFWVMPFIR